MQIALDAKRFPRGRYFGAGVVLLCVVLLGYSERNIFKDMRLVTEALPAIPSVRETDLDLSILFSPVMLSVNRVENTVLRWMKYPPLTLPDAPLPSGNPIDDQIEKARREQGLIHPGDILPLNGIEAINESSMEALGRAIYLSQDRPDTKRDFEQGSGQSTPYPGFAAKSPVEQVQQLFEIAYGPTALRQVSQSEK